jgi:PBP1b-binding outer membrane lipoprotein LpoB
MKKIVSLLMIITLSTLFIVGCNTSMPEKEEVVEKKEDSRFTVTKIDKHTFVLVDNKTQVQYLKVIRNISVDGGVDVIPLVQSSGKPIIQAKINTERFSITEIDAHTFVITDNETNVEYLKVIRNKSVDGGVSLTPLLNADGGMINAKNNE